MVLVEEVKTPKKAKVEVLWCYINAMIIIIIIIIIIIMTMITIMIILIIISIYLALFSYSSRYSRCFQKQCD